MPSERLVPDFKVKVNGSPLPNDLAHCLQWIEVQQSLTLLDMCSLSFDNPNAAVGDRDELQKGNEVIIEGGWMGEVEELFKGDIVVLEPSFPTGGTPTVVVRCYDKLNRYRGSRKQRTFLNQKVSDVIQTLGGEDGLSCQVDDTQVQQEWLVQVNQTNVDCIHELARRNGLEVNVENGSTLKVKKPASDQSKAFTLTFHKDLKSFYVRRSVANVPTEVSVSYWDMKQKKAIVEKADQVHGSLNPPSSAPAESKKAFGDGKVLIANRPAKAPAEAKALAAAAFNDAAMAACQGRGTCVGETKIKPGIVLELLGLGPAWSGLYYVVGATHLMNRVSGYSTEFRVARPG